MAKMETAEKKVDEIVQSRWSEEGGQIMELNLDESESSDTKRYRAILKAALDKMDLKMAEINGLMRNNEE